MYAFPIYMTAELAYYTPLKAAFGELKHPFVQFQLSLSLFKFVLLIVIINVPYNSANSIEQVPKIKVLFGILAPAALDFISVVELL